MKNQGLAIILMALLASYNMSGCTPDNTPGPSVGDNSGNPSDNSGDDPDDGSDDDPDDPISDTCVPPTIGAAEDSIVADNGQTFNLKRGDDSTWGQLHYASTQLPKNLTNARETFQSARYNGRTGWESEKDDVFIPMRSHWAHCTTENAQGQDVDNLFVSMTLQDGATIDDNVGAVFHMQYDDETQSYVRTGNEITLSGLCLQAHGIAAKSDCSRVALLCETEPEKALDPCAEPTKDVVQETGDVFMRQSNNYEGIEFVLRDASLPSTLVNFEKYDFSDPGNIEGLVPFASILPVLEAAHPGEFDGTSNYKSLASEHFRTLIDTSTAFQAKLDDIKDAYRRARQIANDEIWLLEWNANNDAVTLDADYDSYIVSKLAGGSGAKTAMNLIYTDSDDDSKDRGSYGFAHNTRYFAVDGSSHVSGSLNIVKRDEGAEKGIWEFDVYDTDNTEGRGWGKECTLGHVLNMRVTYDPFNEKYSAVCTTDASWLGNEAQWEEGIFEWVIRQHGNIAIKDESNTASTAAGNWFHAIPTTLSYETMGGGHTLVAVDEDTSILAFVAAQSTSKSVFDAFIEGAQNDTLPREQVSRKDTCASMLYYSTPNCDMGFLDHVMMLQSEDETYGGHQPFVNYFALRGAPEPSKVPEFMRTITRIGLLKTNGQEPIMGERVKWVVGDEWDLNDEGEQTLDGVPVGDGTNGTSVACSYSDPQLVNLGNGRLLLGYAKHFCTGSQYTSNAYNQRLKRDGGVDMLVPISYHLAELDLEGNIVEGPIELKLDNGTTFGWGGLDEMIVIGEGKAAWLYIEEPTRENPSPGVPDPLNSEWRVMVYESSHLGD